MAYSSNKAFWSQKTNIKTVVFETEMNPKEDATYSYDVSDKQNKSVMSYLVPDTEDTTKYTLYVQSNEKIYANPNSSSLFYNFTNLESIEGLENLDTGNVTNMSSMFSYCSSLTTLDVSNFDTSNVTDMASMFSNCSSLTTLDVSNFNTSGVTNMYYLFGWCYSLTTLNINNFNTCNVTNMTGIFYGCNNLNSLDVSNFDTSNTTIMTNMFWGCSNLSSLDVSNFDTSIVTSMEGMFGNCDKLPTINVSNFDTNCATSMGSMFYSCDNLNSLDVSNFDTSNVTNMSVMFRGCSSLTTLDLSNFDTINVTDMSYMFFTCISLTTLDLSSFDTSNVTSMGSMFYNCDNLNSLDVSNFDTSNVTNMSSMFQNCYNLTTTITIHGTKATTYDRMFISAATSSGAQITVVYIPETYELAKNMVATKSDTSNVIMSGPEMPEYSINISDNDTVISDFTIAHQFKTITLSTTQEGYLVTSFKMNGQIIEGNSFKMPAENVTITDVVVSEVTIVESEHNPYPNSLNNQEYLNKTWDGATSLTVVLEYQTESTAFDWVYLYDKDNTAYGKYGGTTKKTETLTIPGDTLRIVFRTDGSGDNYYGFKATIIPNY